MKAVVLAGTQSGVGKTTVMLALLQYMQRHGMEVSTFKSGPDFLDPLWHQAITGRPSYNLDTQMMNQPHLLEVMAVNGDCDYGIIEGVMGMFDGRGGVGGKGSSADLARLLGPPVLLVVDAKGMSGSIVPIVEGFVNRAEKLGIRISGVIANRVGSENHAKLLADHLFKHWLPPLIAWLAKDAPALPERHLGLVRPEEVRLPNLHDSFHCDHEGLMAAFGSVIPSERFTGESSAALINKRIAVARDEACCFIYPANLDWLRAQGADVSYFSPVAGDELPEDVDALWLPGGYPELYGAQLAESKSWPSIRAFIEEGGRVLAECGGMMLLGQQLVDHDGDVWPMADILPFETRMQPKLASLGYRHLENGLHGHEFHHSVREDFKSLSPAFEVSRGDQGIRYKNVQASYIHWYFPSAPHVVAEWFGGRMVKAA